MMCSTRAVAVIRSSRPLPPRQFSSYFTNTPTSQRLTPGNSSSIVVLITSLMRNGTTPR